jgi:hypothetical protein
MFFQNRERKWRIELRKKDQSQVQIVFQSCQLRDIFLVATDEARLMGQDWTVWNIQSIQ